MSFACFSYENFPFCLQLWWFVMYIRLGHDLSDFQTKPSLLIWFKLKSHWFFWCAWNRIPRLGEFSLKILVMPFAWNNFPPFMLIIFKFCLFIVFKSVSTFHSYIIKYVSIDLYWKIQLIYCSDRLWSDTPWYLPHDLFYLGRLPLAFLFDPLHFHSHQLFSLGFLHCFFLFTEFYFYTKNRLLYFI